jgi:hypothetical protein
LPELALLVCALACVAQPIADPLSGLNDVTDPLRLPNCNRSTDILNGLIKSAAYLYNGMRFTGGK